MSFIGKWISAAIDKLPQWAKLMWGVLAVIGCVYFIVHDGFWTFLLKMIFSP